MSNESKRVNDIKSVDIQQLAPLTDQQKLDYNRRTAWSWVDAVYILQGFKPAYQLSTEQIRSHFPGEIAQFTNSILLGEIGKEIIRAGENTFIDTPANWQSYWKNFNTFDKKQTENNYVNIFRPEDKRLKDLSDFIDLLKNVAKANDIEIDIFSLPCTKKMLFEEMQERCQHKAHWKVNIDSFYSLWKTQKRKDICDNVNSSTQVNNDFFKNIFK